MPTVRFVAGLRARSTAEKVCERTLTLATTTGPDAHIAIADVAGGLTVADAHTTDANITLSAIAGDLTLTNVTAGGPGRNVTASTTTSGNIPVDEVRAAGGNLSLTAASCGAITEVLGSRFGDATTGLASAADSFDPTIGRLEASPVTGGLFLANQGALQIGGITSGTNAGAAVTGASAGDESIVSTAAGPLVVAENVGGPARRGPARRRAVPRRRSCWPCRFPSSRPCR